MKGAGGSSGPGAVALALLLGALFAALAVAVDIGATLAADLSIRTAAHEWSSPGVTRAANLASFVGGIRCITGAFVAITVGLWLSGKRAPAIRLTAVMATALLVDLITKFGIHRPRPEPFYGPAPESFSFPSGHALFALAFLVTLFRERPDKLRSLPSNVFGWSAVVFFVGAIGLSRIYLGVHYPSDVAGGYVAGGFAIAAASAVLERTRFDRPI